MFKNPKTRYARRSTPWGVSDEAQTYGPGINRYSTPSHGGYILGKRRNAQINPMWRIEDGIYEEDCDWSIVVLTFPQYFSDEDVKFAHWTAERWHSFAYSKLFCSV